MRAARSARSEPLERTCRGFPLVAAERHDRDAEFVDELRDLSGRGTAAAIAQDNGRFDERWCADPHDIGLEDAIDEVERAGF